MTQITENEAKKYLDKISEKDSVAIFRHTDLDGFASAILFYDFCKKKGCTNIKVFPIELGINKLTDYDLTEFDWILISDLPSEVIVQDLQKISKDKNVFYTDHHPISKQKIPENIKTFLTIQQGNMPSSRTVYEICGGKYWLAVTGVLSDFGDSYPVNQDFIQDFLDKTEKSKEYMKQEIMYKIARAIIYFEKNPKLDFFDFLKEIKTLDEIKNLEKYEQPVKQEFEKFIKDFQENSKKFGDVFFFYFEPYYGIKSFLINNISSKREKEIFVFCVPINKEILSISARNQSKEYDVSIILKDCVKNLQNSTAGGHKAAAAAKIPTTELEKFKENLRNYKIRQAKMDSE